VGDKPEEIHEGHHEQLDIERQEIDRGEARDDGGPTLNCTKGKHRNAVKSQKDELLDLVLVSFLDKTWAAKRGREAGKDGDAEKGGEGETR
jgi:hypothetical protein